MAEISRENELWEARASSIAIAEIAEELLEQSRRTREAEEHFYFARNRALAALI